MSEASERVGPGGDGRRKLLVTKRLTVDSDIDAKLAIGILHDPNLYADVVLLELTKVVATLVARPIVVLVAEPERQLAFLSPIANS